LDPRVAGIPRTSAVVHKEEDTQVYRLGFERPPIGNRKGLRDLTGRQTLLVVDEGVVDGVVPEEGVGEEVGSIGKHPSAARLVKLRCAFVFAYKLIIHRNVVGGGWRWRWWGWWSWWGRRWILHRDRVAIGVGLGSKEGLQNRGGASEVGWLVGWRGRWWRGDHQLVIWARS